MKDINEHYSKRYFDTRHFIAWRADAVARAIVEIFKPESVVDAGCSIGDIVAALQRLDVGAFGIDGACEAGYQFLGAPGTFQLKDMRETMVSPGRFDLCCCFDVLTVVEQKYKRTFIRNLQKLSDKILIGVPETERDLIRALFLSAGYTEGSMDAFRAKLESLKSKPAVKGIYYNTLLFEKA
jgi:hypothetical protein